MTWQTIVDWVSPFFYGFAAGYFWFPVYKIIKKIWHEAKLAKQEWKKPRG